jgi:signal transduction histidine kinase
LCGSIVTLWRDRILSRWLRFPPIAISLAWLVFSAVLAVLAAIYGVRPKAENSPWEAVYWIAGGLIPDGQFLCLLGVIAVRLNADLRSRNSELSVEIEHRRRLEQQLSAALATERQARSDQRHLLEIVGHEIRTPLAGIDRSAEMLELMPPSVETVTRRVVGIRGAVRRMIELIDQLLLAERAAPLIQRTEPLVLGALIGQIRSELDAAAAARLRIASIAESASFTADQTAMIAVLRNLVENALKYSPDESPVTVETAEDEGELQIRIIDRGIGIPAEDRTAIGHRFFRAGNVGAIPGTGLGLFAVRRFLADQGGRLSIEPAPNGIGTAMVVTLPLPEPAHEPAVLRYA